MSFSPISIDKEVDEILVKSPSTRFFGIYENITPAIDKKKPTLVIIIGPTGVGKSTFIKSLIENAFHKVTTATTRPKRRSDEPDEYIWITDKKDPYEPEEVYIKRLKDRYDFIEFNTFAYNIYGTPRKSLEIALEGGKAVIGIENNGAREIKKQFEEKANILIFFVLPDNFDQIKRRIKGSRNDIKERIEIAKKEIADSHTITNFYIHNTELPLYSKPDETPLDHSRQNLVNFLKYLLN